MIDENKTFSPELRFTKTATDTHESVYRIISKSRIKSWTIRALLLIFGMPLMEFNNIHVEISSIISNALIRKSTCAI